MTAGRLRSAALLLASGAALLTIVAGTTGCAGKSHANEVSLHLQREDLVATAKALERASAEVASEGAATKAAWPLIVNGLSPTPGAGGEAKIAAAARAAAALKPPSLFGEQRAAELTGPASSIAGTFRTFSGLSAHGWQMIAYALSSERAGGAAARFARANVGLYIESVYDGHFSLAQIGKKLLSSWEKLGGPSAFGASLTSSEVERLAGDYSEQNFRLEPHESIKLGS